jgi:adenylate kinase
MATTTADAQSPSRSLRRGLVYALAFGAAVLSASAAGAVSKRVEKACEKDYYKFCPSYSVGTPELRDCMAKTAKRRALSPRCFDALVDSGAIPRKYLSKRD